MTSKLVSEVCSSLSSLGLLNGVRLLLAVSGGADSVAMLHLVNSLKYKLGFSVCVITVNHNIREKNESRKDAEFVKRLCSTAFNEKIDCAVVEVPRGKIASIASLRKKGIEDAARSVRYKIFEKAKDFFKADYILTAHTKDDFYEGVLMSFFAGASPSSLLGMKMKRGYYLKPLLNIEKKQLKQYLYENRIDWMEDSTNRSLTYLRNRVRISLIPNLDIAISGWRSGLFKTLSKLSLDEAYVNTAYNNFIKTIYYWRCEKEGIIYCKNTQFLSMPDCFKIRFLQEGLILLKIDYRVTYFSITNFIKPHNEGDSISYNGITLTIRNGRLFLQKKQNEKDDKTKTGFMIWVDKGMSISIGKLKLNIKERDKKYFVCSEKDCVGIGPFTVPFCIRSRLQGDVIKINGKEKSLKTILTSYKLSLQQKDMLPIIEVDGEIKALYVWIFGLKNLIAF